ncbi:MAG: hypothetical protein ACK58L_04325 [Planctomycetota bacterium]
MRRALQINGHNSNERPPASPVAITQPVLLVFSASEGSIVLKYHGNRRVASVIPPTFDPALA